MKLVDICRALTEVFGEKEDALPRVKYGSINSKQA
jgi:hypothetical protein